MLGNVEAAYSLSIAVGNEKRGEVVVAFWRAKAPVQSFRVLLHSVWEHDHGELIAAARTRRILQALFRYARFPLPDFPETVRVWRGTCGASLPQALKGYSWTTDRDIACWFAMRFAGENSSPLVLMAEVPREAIAFFSDERDEREIVLLNPPTATVDGNPEDWRERFSVKAAELQTKRMAEMPKMVRPSILAHDPDEHDPIADEISAWMGLATPVS